MVMILYWGATMHVNEIAVLVNLLTEIAKNYHSHVLALGAFIAGFFNDREKR